MAYDATLYSGVAQAQGQDSANWIMGAGPYPVSDGNSNMMQLLISFIEDLLQAMFENNNSNSGGDDGGGDGGGDGGYGATPVAYHPMTASAVGDTAHVTPAGSGNPAGVAEKLVGTSAGNIQANQQVPMDRGVSTHECCANFVSGCLVKSGQLPASQHTDSVAQLSSTLRGNGWHEVSRSQAQPGDVCIVGGDQHTELVASNKNGVITLVGSNNIAADGSQIVSYDGSTGNQGNVVFLAPPSQKDAYGLAA